MKCLLCYEWVKLPRNNLPVGKGIMGSWGKLASRAAYRINMLDRETLLTFIDRIEVGPKILPEGKVKASHRNSEFQQSIRIYYKFVGEMQEIAQKQ